MDSPRRRQGESRSPATRALHGEIAALAALFENLDVQLDNAYKPRALPYAVSLVGLAR